ncbi:MAG: SUMF1/EgtB/PvdO family nonheme iron enzyme [Planctomycetes bacterium]|nr:SUMF1/EgtB/PvdO family nonheme iron enzyme [Planctomycetota bacterium]
MKRAEWQGIRAAFEAAVDLPAAERCRYLDEQLGRDTEMRRAVDRMLRVAAEPGAELEPPTAVALARLGIVAAPSPGTMIGVELGGYRITGLLGVGGMGAVYEAMQTAPKRPVALKVMRTALGSARAVRRFRYESELLARLQHPGIAQVYAAGVLREDTLETPWFAMELLTDARTLVAHCDAFGLDRDARVDLLLQAADAVHHGHQRGVLHRDLKPGNILVTADGRVKVIDFGIGRALDLGGDAEQLTPASDLLGTLAYTSPEQLAESDQVGVRSDVYSLGVVLFQLLAGELPHDLTDKPFREKVRIVCEVTAPRASSRCPGLPREYDWLLQKALEKESARRYGSVAEFADDLRRLQRHEPVLAGPPTLLYALRKFVRRHRFFVLSAALLLVTILAGMTGTAAFALQAERRLDEFGYLANLVHLRAAEDRALALQPAWPDRIEDMVAWLEQRARPLHDRLPELRAALRRLRQRSSSAPMAIEPPELQHLRRKLAALQRAQRVREQRSELPEQPPAPAAPPEDRDGRRLLYLARQCVEPRPGARLYGRELEALALARAAVQRLEHDGAPSTQLARALRTLAWTLHYAGYDGAARDAATRAEALDLDDGAATDSVAALRAAIDDVAAGAGLGEIAATAANLDRLTAAAAAGDDWRFGDQSDQFLHDALVELIAKIEVFESSTLDEVLDRLGWAVRLRGALGADIWLRAREAIRSADGVVASELYARHPIDLEPQPGLMPIGMNPVTGLWEFVHQRSAKHPALRPTHRDDGSVEITDASGIVFVLVPGGSFTMGSSTRRAEDDEAPLVEVELDPFFLARTELTQAQWLRLSGEPNPSWFGPNHPDEDHGQRFDLTHPVENVSWADCDTVFRRHSLMLPTEAQWEYACRAGSITSWFTGNRRTDLELLANVLALPRSGGDRQGTRPVASYPANPFGLHDTSGNVLEWCRDAIQPYVVPHRAGDGLRDAPDDTLFRVRRGGAFNQFAHAARSSARHSAPAIHRGFATGVRAARPLLFGAGGIEAAAVPVDDELRGRIARAVPLRRLRVPERSDGGTDRTFNPALRPLTVGALVRLDAANGVVVAHGGDHRGYALYVRDRVPAFCVRNGAALSEVVGPPLELGRQVHLVGRLDEHARLELFVDGELAAAGPGALLASKPVEGLSIARDAGTLVGPYDDAMSFHGSIEALRLYQGALPVDELRRWATATR